MFYPVSLLYNQAEEGVKNNHIKLPVCSVLLHSGQTCAQVLML